MVVLGPNVVSDTPVLDVMKAVVLERLVVLDLPRLELEYVLKTAFVLAEECNESLVPKAVVDRLGVKVSKEAVDSAVATDEGETSVESSSVGVLSDVKNAVLL